MRMAWLVLVPAVMLGCGSGQSPADLGLDLSAASDLADAAATVAALGGPCTTNANCTDGVQPTCFVHTLFNLTGKLGTANGFCSSTCSADGDCGPSGVCITFTGNAGSWCFNKCAVPTECRSGYACFRSNGGHCFPNENLNCDPTAAGGRCTNAPLSNPGGCLRQALGGGNSGACFDGCSVGPGACPPAKGLPRQCIVYNQTSGATTMGDQWKGAVCINSFSTNAAGQECTAQTGVGLKDFIDACADGLECNLASAFGGDNKCRALCRQSGGADGGGGGSADGGAPACPPGQSCQDVWSLFGTATPWGLCR